MSLKALPSLRTFSEDGPWGSSLSSRALSIIGRRCANLTPTPGFVQPRGWGSSVDEHLEGLVLDCYRNIAPVLEWLAVGLQEHGGAVYGDVYGGGPYAPV